jgi:hypothetical protein
MEASAFLRTKGDERVDGSRPSPQNHASRGPASTVPMVVKKASPPSGAAGLI